MNARFAREALRLPVLLSIVIVFLLIWILVVLYRTSSNDNDSQEQTTEIEELETRIEKEKEEAEKMSDEKEKEKKLKEIELLEAALAHKKQNEKHKNESGRPFQGLMVLLVTAFTGGVFWIIFWWSKKRDEASYLGGMFKDTVYEVEFKRLSAPYEQKKEQRGYVDDVRSNEGWLATNPEPERPIDVPRIGPGSGTGGGARTGSAPGSEPQSLTEDQHEKIQAHRDAQDNWWRAVQAEAKRRYEIDINEARKKAVERAKRAASVDLSVLQGRGGEFVLNFTALLVIIFAAMVLGILNVLEHQQIGTLLAAIAGYVLGRAARPGSETPGVEKETESKPAQVTVKVEKDESPKEEKPKTE